MTDPKRIHEQDQALAVLADVGSRWARMYSAMVGAGMPPEHAVRVVCAAASAMFAPRPEPPAS